MLIEAIALGLVYSFVFFEVSGLVAGGLVAPGYLALSVNRPAILAVCLGTALIVMLAVRLLSMVSILYGRRRFMLCILLAFALQWTAGSLLMGSQLAEGRVEIVGYIIPGLIAHEMDRQGVGKTLASLLLLTSLVYLTMRGLGWLRAI